MRGGAGHLVKGASSAAGHLVRGARVARNAAITVDAKATEGVLKATKNLGRKAEQIIEEIVHNSSRANSSKGLGDVAEALVKHPEVAKGLHGLGESFLRHAAGNNGISQNEHSIKNNLRRASATTIAELTIPKPGTLPPKPRDPIKTSSTTSTASPTALEFAELIRTSTNPIIASGSVSAPTGKGKVNLSADQIQAILAGK